MREVIYIVFITAIISCKKDELPVNILDGKLKTIERWSRYLGDSLTDSYYFIYDSVSGNLTKVSHNNIDTVFVIKWGDSAILLHYTYLLTAETYLYATLNSSGNIQDMMVYPPPFINDPYTTYHRFIYYPNNSIDTIYMPRSFDIYDKLCDIVSDGNNYTQLICYDSYSYYDPTVSYIDPDTLRYNYTSYLNTGQVPFQQIHIFSTNNGQISDLILEPTFLLSLSGYGCYKPNKNLIHSAANGLIYSYTFNSNNQVVEMSYSPTLYENYYKMTYY